MKAMTQKELDRLKMEAEKMGRWAVYLLAETEYWTPMALNKLTMEELQAFQTEQAQWLMENEMEYPAGGAAEMLREETLQTIQMQEGCLTEDEAYEMESQRLNGMTIEELPKRLAQYRAEQETARYEEEIEQKLMSDLPLSKEETKYVRQLPKDHLLQELLAIDEEK